MEDKKYEERFTKGYNDGYILSRFEPKLIKQVMENPKANNPYFDGLAEGHKASQRELFTQHLKNTQAANTQNKKPRIR